MCIRDRPVTVDWSIISDRKELDLLGVHLSPFCYDTVIEWIGNGKLPTDGVVTHKFPLEKWEEGFHIAKTGENGALKLSLIHIYMGIPVIAYDRLIRESDAIDYYVSFDNYKVGQLSLIHI